MLQRGHCLKDLKQTEHAMRIFRQVAVLHPRMPALRKLRQWMRSVEAAEELHAADARRAARRAEAPDLSPL